MRVVDRILAQAARTPNATAVVEDGGAFSYSELARLIADSSRALRGLGLQAGDRLAVVGENALAMLVWVLAANQCDAWAVPLNARLSAGEVDSIARHCTPRLCVFTDRMSPAAAAHGQRLGASLHDFGALGAWLATPARADAVPEAPASSVGDTVAVLVYTTGTTGAPKGVMLTHAQLLAVNDALAAMGNIVASDRVYMVLPLSHIFGLNVVAFLALQVGAALVMAPRFSPAHLAEAIVQQRVTVIKGVAAMYAQFAAHVDAHGLQLQPHHLRLVYASGAPTDRATSERVARVLGLPLHTGYGMTETSSAITRKLYDTAPGDSTVGRPIAGVELRVRRTDGSDAPSGEVGELLVRGPGVMLGYYREPELTRQALAAGRWLQTGDLGCIDAQGQLRVVGRSKELIIRSGFNVHPQEVEAAINSHPAVVVSAVVGRAVEGNEEVVAFVQCRPAPAGEAALCESDLQAHLRQHLAPYKQPSAVVFVDALPQSATGKVLKAQLRERASALPIHQETP